MSLIFLYIFSFLILIIYSFFILYLHHHWEDLEISEPVIKAQNLPFISIIIVGRNESVNIKPCIDSILTNEYPKTKYEIIYIDDGSDDDSIDILNSIKSVNFSFYRLEDLVNSKIITNHKKTALKQAVKLAKGEIILQTDADTVVGKKWIKSQAVQYLSRENINLITAPVLFFKGTSLLEQFQYYDILTTMGITGAGIRSKKFFMANGANMSYRKSLYQNIEINENFASGDDIFLIGKAAEKDKDSISFLKSRESVVYTYPEKTLKDFLRQRIRWATKTKGYSDFRLTGMIALVFLTNFLLIINFFVFLFTASNLFLIFLILKLLIDSYFILNISKFFNEKVNCCYLILSLLLYPFYLTFVGVLSLFITKYDWKGREVK